MHHRKQLPHLKLDEQAIDATREKMSAHFISTDPNDPFLDIHGERRLGIYEIGNRTQIGHDRIGSLLSSGTQTTRLTDTGLLSDPIKDRLIHFLSNDLKRPLSDVSAFSKEFDKLRELTGYDAANQKHWTAQMRDAKKSSHKPRER
jgi:hypothetical protein